MIELGLDATHTGLMVSYAGEGCYVWTGTNAVNDRGRVVLIRPLQPAADDDDDLEYAAAIGRLRLATA